VSPNESPTMSQTDSPTVSPNVIPTASPTESPTVSPNESPTMSQTDSPTVIPTVSPNESPTMSQTDSPTVSPNVIPSESPKASPSVNPNACPTISLIDISQIETRLHGDIRNGRDELISTLKQYGRERPDLFMMVRDLHASDERLLGDIDAEQQQVHQNQITLELDEQRAHDVELSQLDDDILYHINSKIEDIIAQNEQIDNDDDNSNRDWYQEQPGPSDNDINSDNDSELTPEALIDAIIENTNMSDIDDWGALKQSLSWWQIPFSLF
jgi:hypothetical protein